MRKHDEAYRPCGRYAKIVLSRTPEQPTKGIEQKENSTIHLPGPLTRLRLHIQGNDTGIDLTVLGREKECLYTIPQEEINRINRAETQLTAQTEVTICEFEKREINQISGNPTTDWRTQAVLDVKISTEAVKKTLEELLRQGIMSEATLKELLLCKDINEVLRDMKKNSTKD